VQRSDSVMLSSVAALWPGGVACVVEMEVDQKGCLSPRTSVELNRLTVPHHSDTHTVIPPFHY
jgi:hypothetical protein